MKTKEPELYYGPSAEKFYITEDDINRKAAKVFNEENWLKDEHVAYLSELWSLKAGTSDEDYFITDITSPNIFVFAPYKVTGEEIYENPEGLYDRFVQNANPGEKIPIRGFGNAVAAAKIMLDNGIVDLGYDAPALGYDSYKQIRLECEVVLHFSGGNPYVESIDDDEPWEWYLSYEKASRELSWAYPMKDTPQLLGKHVPFAYVNSYAEEGVWRDNQIEVSQVTTQVDENEFGELERSIMNTQNHIYR